MASVSSRVQAIKPSPTLAVTNKAAQLCAQGFDVIGLGAGEPDFDTPDHIKAAAIEAIHSGQTKYTAVDGTDELKQAVIDKFKRDNGLTYTPAQVLVSCGGKQSFFNLCLALLNPKDEVVIPAPYWVSYPDIVKIAEATPVIITADQTQSFKITPQQLASAITPKTRLVVINSPSNPTGVAYTETELAGLGDVLRQHPHVFIATDDMYEHMIWNKSALPFKNILNTCPDLYDRTFVLNGVSKAYSMTGWRIGYAAGPVEVIKAMKTIQSQSTSNPCSIAQAAACAALNGDQSFVSMMCNAFHERHDMLVAELNKISGISCIPADGTFYLFPNVAGLMKQLDIATDLVLAERLLTEAQVALVPGSAFGLDGHMRLSFATSETQLRKALDRIKQFVEKNLA
ncbi:MAG: pyridoxal phosphate-dependent aminotransferase [Pseudomonadota bacterium]